MATRSEDDTEVIGQDCCKNTQLMALAEFYTVTTPPCHYNHVLLLFYSTKGISALEKQKKKKKKKINKSRSKFREYSGKHDEAQTSWGLHKVLPLYLKMKHALQV